jgi:phosphohistidine phosphatase
LKTLHLLRHAKAAEGDIDGTDHARPLAKRGVKDAEAMAAYLKGQNFKVDRVYASSSRRTKETYERVAPALGGAAAAFRDRLYLVDKSDLLDFVQSLPDSVGAAMLIGHNPTFHATAMALIHRPAAGQDQAFESLGEKFSTGALCSIEFDCTHWREVKAGEGTLTRYVRPKDIGSES